MITIATVKLSKAQAKISISSVSSDDGIVIDFFVCVRMFNIIIFMSLLKLSRGELHVLRVSSRNGPRKEKKNNVIKSLANVYTRVKRIAI